MRSHSQALTIKLKKNIPIEVINEIISNGNQWVKLIPNEKESSITLLSPAEVSGKLDIAVGRVRKLDIDENCISFLLLEISFYGELQNQLGEC